MATIQDWQNRIDAVDETMANLAADGASAVSAFGQSSTSYPLGSLIRLRAFYCKQLNRLVAEEQGLDSRFGVVSLVSGPEVGD